LRNGKIGKRVEEPPVRLWVFLGGRWGERVNGVVKVRKNKHKKNNNAG